MYYYQIATYLVVLSALFGFINARWLRLPNTIGLMAIALIFTLLLQVVGFYDDTLVGKELDLLRGINFETLLLDIMLSFLLFAGAMHTDLTQLKSLRKPILAFASVGVLISTVLIGICTYFVLGALGLATPLLHCLLFGALISPTDPIAVLGLMRSAKAPQKLEIKIVGESLFNDGVGVVVFVTLLAIITGDTTDTSLLTVGQFFIREVVGGICLGVAAGWICAKVMQQIDSLETEVMLTIALVMGGTGLAAMMEVSAPLAMVMAGLVFGDAHFKRQPASGESEHYLEVFWRLIDEILNTLLFVLIGLEVLLLTFESRFIYAGLIMIPLLWLCRYLSLALPIALYSRQHNFVPKTNLIMTWAGLRGGISIALVLSLPESATRELFLIVTYIVVVASILFQGLTLAPLIRHLIPEDINHD